MTKMTHPRLSATAIIAAIAVAMLVGCTPATVTPTAAPTPSATAPPAIGAVTTAAVRGIVIETVDGVSVGDDPAALEAAYPDRISYGTNSSGNVYSVSYGEIPLPDFDFGNGEDGPFSFGVGAMGVVGGPITEVFAPTGGGPGV